MTFNQFEWALRARGRYEMPTWAFTAHNDSWKIAGAGRAAPDKLVQVTYTDPGELIVKTRRHCESLAELTPDEAASLGPVLHSAVRALETVVPAERSRLAL